MVVDDMTNEQVGFLTHVEALISPLMEKIDNLKHQIELDSAERAVERAELRAETARLSERIAVVEKHQGADDAAARTRADTFRLIGAAVAGTLSLLVALGLLIVAVITAV